MVCLETACAKFAETIVEAIGREPERPAGYATSRCDHSASASCADIGRLKAYLESHAQ